MPTDEALRDRFAMEYLRQALSGWIPERQDFARVTRDAYAFADAALIAREGHKRKEEAADVHDSLLSAR
jgi:hypothetical protein